MRPDLKTYRFAITWVCFLSTPDQLKKNHLEMTKIALIFIYLTYFWSFLLRSASCVYIFFNVHATIINLAYFNPHNPQLAG